VVAEETILREAHDLCRATTGIPVCPTGASGVAGLMALQLAGEIEANSPALVLFTGVQR
jgi:threonine synthase